MVPTAFFFSEYKGQFDSPQSCTDLRIQEMFADVVKQANGWIPSQLVTNAT